MSPDRIRALEFNPVSPRTALAVAGHRVRPDLLHGGPGSPLRLREIPRPERPAGWVRIAPTLAGICASDRKILEVTKLGFSAQAIFGSGFHRWILGHEVVGEVIEADPGGRWREGDRVVAEPTLSCVHKGLPACPRCEAGDDHLCEHLADPGTLTPGHGFGHHARYGGGWAEELVAPADRVHAVPDALEDRVAVLAEPTAVSVHAVLRTPPPPAGTALVIGPGAIGLACVHALTTLTEVGRITVAGIDPGAQSLVTRAGAHALLTGTGRTLVAAAGADLATTVRGDRLTGPVLESGYDVVYDAVGSPQTLRDALRMTRPGGAIVLLATSARIDLDLTLLWLREIRLAGTAYYGREAGPGGSRRTFEIALDVLADRRPDHLITHTFPLDAAPEALATAAAGPAAGAVRVAFTPQG